MSELESEQKPLISDRVRLSADGLVCQDRPRRFFRVGVDFFLHGKTEADAVKWLQEFVDAAHDRMLDSMSEEGETERHLEIKTIESKDAQELFIDPDLCAVCEEEWNEALAGNLAYTAEDFTEAREDEILPAEVETWLNESEEGKRYRKPPFARSSVWIIDPRFAEDGLTRVGPEYYKRENNNA